MTTHSQNIRHLDWHIKLMGHININIKMKCLLFQQICGRRLQFKLMLFAVFAPEIIIYAIGFFDFFLLQILYSNFVDAFNYASKERYIIMPIGY